MGQARKFSGMSDAQPLTSPISPFDDVHTAYDSGDLGMQHGDTPYSPPLATPDSTMDAKRGNYTYLNTPTSTFDMDPEADKESLMEDQNHHHFHHGHHHVKRFDHNETRRMLLKTGSAKFGVTLLFSVLMCVGLKAWEGFAGEIVLSKIDVRIFNAVMIGLSLCLGLNLLSSLKHYSNTFRWSFLARRYVSLETFDLILHSASLIKITKLMFISMPGLRKRAWFRKMGWFRDVRDDGTKWMWLVCFLWLSINITSQVLVALLSLFWPVENSLIPLMSPGNVSIADLNVWYIETNEELGNETAMESAWSYGTESNYYPEFAMNETKTDLSTLPGTPLYKSANSWEYRFFNRDPDHLYTNYVLGQRKVQATAKCNQLEVRSQVVDNGTNMYIDGKLPGAKEWTRYDIPELAGGAITWIASSWEYCGPRCTNFTVLQNSDNTTVKDTSLFLCNSTLGKISEAGGSKDITAHSDEDKAAAYGTDEFARIAAGAIGFTGIQWNNWTFQLRSYSPGSKWSPARTVKVNDVEDMLMRFTAGAVAAFDDHGIKYNMTNQRTRPTPGQRLDVDWKWIFIILGGICGIQLIALVLLVVFANRTIVRDESFFSMAMLLSPVVEKIGRRAGMNLSGEEIKDHPKLKWKKIRYDYREGKAPGEPNQVDIFFEGKDKKEGRKSWAAGSYS